MELLEMHKVEKFVVDGESSDPPKGPIRVTGYWKEITFSELKRGDVFRLWDTDKDTGTLKPDHLNEDGHHDVCVATSDAKKCEPDGNYVVESFHLNGFLP